MDDKSNVGFVDTHTKCDSGEDDLYVVSDELVLVSFANFAAKSSMVRKCFDSFLLKFAGDLIDMLSA